MKKQGDKSVIYIAFIILAIIGIIDFVSRYFLGTTDDGIIVIGVYFLSAPILGEEIARILFVAAKLITGFWIIWAGLAYVSRPRKHKKIDDEKEDSNEKSDISYTHPKVRSIKFKKNWNRLAIVAFAITLCAYILAWGMEIGFLIAPISLIVGIYSIRQIKKTHESGKWLAWLSIIFGGLLTLLIPIALFWE